MNRSVLCALALVVAGNCAAGGPKPPPVVPDPALQPLPVGDPKKPAVTLFDDQAERLIPYLTNDQDVNGRAATAGAEELDVFAGAAALRIGPQQRFRAELPGWSYPIREAPKEGEFRFIRFAWKKIGGTGITLQLHNKELSSWANNRYYAGNKFFGWLATPVATDMPTEWTVVTRDVFKDFGNITITGMAFASTDGTAGLFDHVVLGRTVADLDAATNEALGRVKPKEPLVGKPRDAAWDALGARDWEKAGPAVRAFLSTAPAQVAFVRERLLATAGSPEQMAVQARVTRFVTELGADDFETRVRAEEELEKIGAPAGDGILGATRSPDPEVAYRANRLAVKLKIRLTDVPLAAVHAARVARVLERAGSAEAVKLLAAMAAGDFGPYHATAAKPALGRLLKK